VILKVAPLVGVAGAAKTATGTTQPPVASKSRIAVNVQRILLRVTSTVGHSCSHGLDFDLYIFPLFLSQRSV
jgi:hypothetical protein